VELVVVVGVLAAVAGAAASRPVCPIMISSTASVLARTRGHAPRIRSAMVEQPFFGL
jgi:hypothetical protein